MSESQYGKKWEEEETILAFYYYCKIPFGKIHKGDPTIIRIANLLHRTPSSVVFKMGNLGHFDPELQKRNVNGLSNASKTDETVVKQFYNNWEDLCAQAIKIEATFSAHEDIKNPVGGTVEQMVNGRVNQDFFRESVLASYNYKCCITGLPIPTLLIASHIKPWAVSNPTTERTNPANGLCLNAFHDRAFDSGLITVKTDYTICLSSQLQKYCNEEGIGWLSECKGMQIHLPEKFKPEKKFLQYHNDVIFIP